jgi:hypothetical protein
MPRQEQRELGFVAAGERELGDESCGEIGLGLRTREGILGCTLESAAPKLLVKTRLEREEQQGARTERDLISVPDDRRRGQLAAVQESAIGRAQVREVVATVPRTMRACSRETVGSSI